MLNQPRLEGCFIKNRRGRFDELKDVVVIADAGVKFSAGMAVIETAIKQGINLPVSHLVWPAPRHRAGRGGNTLSLASGKQYCGIVYRALHMVTASQRVTRVGKSLLKIHHDERKPFAKTDVP